MLFIQQSGGLFSWQFLKRKQTQPHCWGGWQTLIRGFTMSGHHPMRFLCVTTLAGRVRQWKIMKHHFAKRGAFQNGLVYFQFKGVWMWWWEMNCGPFNNWRAQKFPKIIQHSSPRCDVLAACCPSSRTEWGVRVVFGCWAEILKGVCRKKNERRTLALTKERSFPQQVCTRTHPAFWFHLASRIWSDVSLMGAAG